MDFRISHLYVFMSLFAISFYAAAMGPFDEARDFVIAKSKEISLEQTGSAEFSMKYMAPATERAAEICQQPESSRSIANRISSEACDVVAEKIDSQRKLLGNVSSEDRNGSDSNGDLGKWVFWSNSGPVLYPMERDKFPIVLAVVNTKTWLISLIDMRKPGVPGATCFDGEATQGIDDVAPLKINGKYVKFKAVCLGQVGILQPSTESGKKYLNEATLSGGKVVVGLSDNDILTFPDSDVKDMKRRVSEINAAM